MKTVKITAILTLIAILSASLISCVDITKYGFERAESFSIGGFEISAENIEVDKLEINWVSGSVKLTPNDKNVISVTETEQTSEDNKLRYELAGGKLTVAFCKPGLLITSLKDKALEISIPGDMLSALSELKASTVSADLSLGAVTAKYAEIKTVSAKTRLDLCGFESLDLDTVSGDMEANCEIQKLKVNTVSAKTALHCEDAPQQLSYNSVSGNLEIKAERYPGFTAQINALGGKLESSLELKESGKDRVYKDGECEYHFNSVTGNVRLDLA